MNQPLKILHVEDNPLDAELIQRLLRKTFHQPLFEVVSTATAFAEQLRRFAPDVILCDNTLPLYSAEEALELTQRQTPHTPFILVTGTVADEHAIDVIKNGADDYILKDRMVRLPAAIEAALSKRRIIKEKEEYVQLLAQSQHNLQTIFDNASEGFVLLDTAWRVKAFNKTAKTLLQFYIGQEIEPGQPLLGMVDESRQAFFENVLHRVSEGECIDYDRSFTTPSGDAEWIHFSFRPAMDNGKVSGICITGRDITARKLDEQLLQQSVETNKLLAERLSTILNTLPANISLLDENGIIIDVNDSWKNFGANNGFVGTSYGVGTNYLQVTEASGAISEQMTGITLAEKIRQVLKGQQSQLVFEYTCEAESEQRWFRMIATSLAGKAYRGAVVMHIDISEIRKLEQERLTSQMNEQKRITRVMLEAQEKERNAIGIELHDNVNQILVGTNLMLSHIRSTAGENAGAISDVMDNLQQVIAENRKIAHEFVAPDLHTESLAQQLEVLTNRMLVRSGIHVNVHSDALDESLLDTDRRFNIYRIAQEQCINILKYAKAKNASLQADTSGGMFIMRISDDGVGMSPDKQSAGIGIRNIRHRVSLFNGSATIETAPGKGFKLTVRLPLKEDAGGQ